MDFEGANGFLHVDRERPRFNQSYLPGQLTIKSGFRSTWFDLAVEQSHLKSLTRVSSVAVA